MTNTTQISPKQAELVQELVEAYGIDPAKVRFFNDEPEPFLGYENDCIVLNRIAPDVRGITPTAQISPFADSIGVRVELEFADGQKRSGLGVANLNECDEHGEVLSSTQILLMAQARALRAALRTAGISILQLHRRHKLNSTVAEMPAPKTERAALLAQVHALGYEAGLIKSWTGPDGSNNTDKSHWRSYLMHRYGVSSCDQLSNELLADLAASLRPVAKKAA